MKLVKIFIIAILTSCAGIQANSKVTAPTEQPSAQQSPSEAPKNVEQPAQLPHEEQQPPHSLELSPLPSSTEMTTSYESAFVRMLVTLLGLVLLVVLTFWFLRKIGKGKFRMGNGRTINILERRALSPKTTLFVVEVGNKKILVSESQLEVRTLTVYEELPESTD